MSCHKEIERRVGVYRIGLKALEIALHLAREINRCP
jgi:hypothetical protein